MIPGTRTVDELELLIVFLPTLHRNYRAYEAGPAMADAGGETSITIWELFDCGSKWASAGWRVGDRPDLVDTSRNCGLATLGITRFQSTALIFKVHSVKKLQ